MVLHVVDALAELPLERIVVVVGHGAERRDQDAARAARHRGAGRVRRAARATRDRRRRERRAHRRSTTSTPRTTSSCSRATRRSCAPRRSPSSRPSTASRTRPRRSSPPSSPEPFGLGRVVRDKDGRVARVVEHADATAEEREIDEINTSIYCFRRSLLAPALRRLSPENAQGEYYLTDVDRGVARRRPQGDRAARPTIPREAIMVNDRVAARRGRGRAARAHQPRVDALGRHDGRSRPRRTSTRRSSSRPTCACCRARSSRAAR